MIAFSSMTKRVALGGLGLVLACGGGSERGLVAAPEAGRDVAAAPPSPPSSSESRAPGVPASRGGLDRLGQPAPAWGELEWLDGTPRSLQDLRGQVVLIRFWTDTCPFCRATAPALAQLDADYRERGVTVVGMYHPKPRGTVRTAAEVAEVTEAWGWRFPVALDRHWATLDAFWLHSRPEGSQHYTSVSFVLDREGVIRYVHPGPEFHPEGPADHETCRQDYADVRATLEALLAEPTP